MKKIVIFLAVVLAISGSAIPQSDSALRSVIDKDRSSRSADGRLVTLTAAEHLARGRVYFDNRQFPQAREHFQKILDNFPTDEAMSGALFMTGRSYYWERNYAQCIPFLDRVVHEYPATKDGREGLYFEGSCNLRIGKNLEAAKLYEQYTVMYPTGERSDGAYLNIIDALREAGKYDDADRWVENTRTRFSGTPTEANALHARLRMQIFRGQYADAVATAALMQAQVKFAGSMASMDEVKYLRAFALEKQGKLSEAKMLYMSTELNTYYGSAGRDRAREARFKGIQPTLEVLIGPLRGIQANDYPAAFRDEILAAAKPRKLDPRFILAIMKQESTFKSDARSPAAARGLMQQTIDTALKYNIKAGYPNVQPDDLYNPKTNITIACENLADLQRQFNGMLEAVAAAYNGGDDNVARWLNRSKPKDPAIFASEVGFSETKNYVFKVMTNYRIYKQLYDENLNRR
jgi:soluble lytic murein transglycosylase